MTATPATPPPILSDAVYDDAALAVWHGIPARTLRAARRAGDLRHAKAGTRTIYLGRWLLDWLERSGGSEGGAS